MYEEGLWLLFADREVSGANIHDRASHRMKLFHL